MKRLIAALAIVASTTASAEFLDGNALLSRLNSNAVDTSMALGFVVGVHDAGHGVVHCSPANITAGQVSDMVKFTLNNHPQERHRPAWFIVHWTLQTAWPCPKKGNSL
jgi:hypothetical protein